MLAIIAVFVDVLFESLLEEMIPGFKFYLILDKILCFF
jgi:hypothetical protein